MAAAAVQAPPQAAEAEAPSLAYRQVPETQYDLEWAQLATLDLSTFDQPGGKAALAKQLEAALQTIGFFYVVRFGLSQDEVDRQFAIGQAVFALPTDEKLRYRADLENGGYNGYKPLGLRAVVPGVRDNPEIYNIPKCIPPTPRARTRPSSGTTSPRSNALPATSTTTSWASCWSCSLSSWSFPRMRSLPATATTSSPTTIYAT
ncbi:hypothetical protein VTK73DRAFT_1317 [Phialemonium thermophilum]|uniref:Non-haem dioxygenase N-terminal domain-containing protein n=1 Tax=Phialemonium thermophilum TaxID=223376 RepID=A0ABR3VTM1_9PEZI